MVVVVFLTAVVAVNAQEDVVGVVVLAYTAFGICYLWAQLLGSLVLSLLSTPLPALFGFGETAYTSLVEFAIL